jgi:hypothetical protein
MDADEHRFKEWVRLGGERLSVDAHFERQRGEWSEHLFGE